MKQYAAAGQALLLVVVVNAYSALARRVGRQRLIATVYLFFVSNLLVFAVLARANVSGEMELAAWFSAAWLMSAERSKIRMRSSASGEDGGCSTA